LTLKQDTDNNGTYDKTVATQTTDSSGFDFGYLPAGNYQLSAPNTTDWTLESSANRTFTLGGNQSIHFAYVPAYIISGTVFIDNNRNGNKDSDDTTGYQGATVTVKQGSTVIGTDVTDADGHYSVSGFPRGTYTVTVTTPSGYKTYSTNPQTITIPQGSNQQRWSANFGINEVYTIAGQIYVDANKNNTYDSGVDTPLANVVVHAVPQGTQASSSDRSDADGNFLIPNIEPGDFQLTANPGSDYTTLGQYPRNVTITNGNAHQRDLRFYGKYTISGNVFVDTDDSKTKNGSETNYAANPGITMANYPSGAPHPQITNNTDGTYTVTNLISGQYTVRYPSLPSGYVMNHPRNGPPASFLAGVGSSCTEASPAPGGTCNASNLDNLNFAIKSGQPWFQGVGLDIRFDNGINNPVPPAPNSSCGGAYALVPGSSSTPGLVFSGSTPANFWQGQASSTNQVVGGSTYPETFTPSNGSIIQTSYAYMQSVIKTSNITPINLSTVCTLSSCNLPNNLAHGVYQANGDVTLNSYTLPANADYVFLINGNLTLSGSTMSIPVGSTAIFIASKDIHVASTVGRTTPVCPQPASSNVQGMFSADQSFIIDSSADCGNNVSDKQLSIEGAIVVNAGGQGGSFQNNRTLCTNNINYPSVSIRERGDFILNAPDLLRTPNFIWQEVAP
ncbi:MAG TPA: SdrD B-like domain-containing protein, partial [Patescibacteria group bacterium]|nr:SdrD B-like domain-containing protein [Patescibacteria group bacterium]